VSDGAMRPSIYVGKLRHRRFQPVRHEFTYPVFMVMLDIDAIPALMKISPLAAYNRFNCASYYERDHFGDPSVAIRERLREDASAEGVALPEGPIYLLTHLRYFGYNFNPVSFFYCCDPQGRLETILAEVNSTFGESHNYWLNSSNQLSARNSLRYRVTKAMHVSPFMKMELDYTFSFTAPDDRLVAHMQTLDDGERFFDATLDLRREPWTARSLHRALAVYPCMTAKVIAAIHWQALRLYVKGCPVFTKPVGRKSASRTLESKGESSLARVARP
jgi:uncharacterized protein